MMKFDDLKTIHRDNRENFKEEFSTRIHRSLSWIKRAEMETEDSDASFIFLWIAFNAAYTSDRSSEEGVFDKSLMTSYFQKLVKHGKKEIHELITNGHREIIIDILENEYLINPFWNNKKGEDFWKYIRSKEKRDVENLMDYEDCIGQILTIIFNRFYVLRDQVMHGGATWNSSVNRNQVNDCNSLMKVLVPLFTEIMLNNPDEEWGALPFPVKTEV